MSPISNSTLPAVRISRWLIAGFCCLLATADTARAVIVRSGAANTTAPADDPGFANIGKGSTGQSSITYLGSRWFITANHVTINGSGVTFGATNYAVDLASKRVLNNPSDPGNPAADLALYRLTTDPGLPSLAISSTPLSVGNPVVMIGNGFARGAQRSWNVVQNSPSNWTWTENGVPTTHSGFNVDGSNTIRWGTNNVSQVGLFEADGFGTNHDFRTTFNDDLANLPNEAHVSLGDSGGGAFFKNGANWTLAGLMLASADFPNQPTSPSTGLPTAVFGNQVAIADLSFYRSQITSIVPEPGSMALALAGAIAVGVAGWRTRRNQRVRVR